MANVTTLCHLVKLQILSIKSQLYLLKGVKKKKVCVMTITCCKIIDAADRFFPLSLRIIPQVNNLIYLWPQIQSQKIIIKESLCKAFNLHVNYP